MKKFNVFAALVAVLVVCGCSTALVSNLATYEKTTAPDGTVTEKRHAENRISALGDRAVEQNLKGSLADATEDDLSAGVRESGQRSESGAIAEVAKEGLGLARDYARLQALQAPLAAAQAAPQAQSGSGGVNAAAGTGSVTQEQSNLPAVSTAVLEEHRLEAVRSGKTLIVVSCAEVCSRCRAFKTALDADTGFAERLNAFVYAPMTADWASNPTVNWTGGGAAPVVRVTLFDSSGKVVCDKKLNNPTLAQVEAAAKSCTAE